MNLLKWHSEVSERMRVRLGWSHYAIYWVSFIKGVSETLCMRLSPCSFGGSLIEPFWV